MIYSDGYVEVTEYDENNGDWTRTIGRSDDNKDDMLYARTSKFYSNQDNSIIDAHFEHYNDTFLITLVGS